MKAFNSMTTQTSEQDLRLSTANANANAITPLPLSHSVTPRDNLPTRLQMATPSEPAMLNAGKLHGRLTTSASGSNQQTRSNAIMPRPSYAFQRPYLFHRSAATHQNHYLRHLNMDSPLGGQRTMLQPPFPSIPCDSTHRTQNRQLGVMTGQLPFVQQQQQNPYPFMLQQQQQQQPQQQKPYPFMLQQQQQKPHTFMLQQQQQQSYPTSFVQLPQNDLKLLSQSSASAPFGIIKGKDPPTVGNHGQAQVDDSVQQTNSPLGRHYAPAITKKSFPNQRMQIGKENLTTQVSRLSTIPSLKRPASQPLSPTVQEQRRKTQQTQPFIQPPLPPWTRFTSVPNTPQEISPLVYAPRSFTPQATQSFVPPPFPTNSSKYALPSPNTTQTICPLRHTAPFVPPIDNSVLRPSQPSSHPPPLPNQQHLIAQSLARQRLMNKILQSSPSTAHNYIKYKDQTPEPIGYKCMLCKRDLSYAPEGPISQPPIPPAAAVLSCGHTFHQHCLERMTLDDQSKDPPCIPCALGKE